MKPVIWIAAALVVIGGAYMWYSGQSAPEQAAPAPEASSSEEAQPAESTETATEAATEAVTDAVDDAADTASEAATDAVEAASDAATEATEAASEAVTEATEAATDAATEATEAASDAVTEATEAATDAATEATEAATEAAETATEAATDAVGDLGSLLTLDGFDMDKVVEAIGGSSLSEVQKTTLTTGLQQAKDNPELLKGVLDQIKSALGL